MSKELLKQTLSEIKILQKKSGGWPRQDRMDKLEGSWSTSCVLLLHREINFLSSVEISKAVNFLKKSVCINKKKNMYGWGSFQNSTMTKEPIPVITANVLLSLAGFQNLDKYIKHIYLLSVQYLLLQQEESGHWENIEDDYYSNMQILLTLKTIKEIYKEEYKHVYAAINNSLNKAKEYYIKIDCDDIYLIMIKSILEIETNYEFTIPEDFSVVSVRKNRAYSQENFGFTKYPVIYNYLFSYLDSVFYKKNEVKISEISKKILKNKQTNGFWTVEEKDSIWLTCDAARYYLKYIKIGKLKNNYFDNIVTFDMKTTPFEKVIFFLKYAYKFKSIAKLGINSLITSYESQ